MTTQLNYKLNVYFTLIPRLKLLRLALRKLFLEEKSTQFLECDICAMCELTFSVFNCVCWRGIAGLRLPALVDGDHSELNLGLLREAHHLELQLLVAGGRAQIVHRLPVPRPFLLLDDVVGDRRSTVAGGRSPTNVRRLVVIIENLRCSGLAGLV